MIFFIEKYPEILGWFFGYFSMKNPPLEEQLYVFMKRLHTQPSEFFSMERGLRLRIYQRERDLIEYEHKKIQELNSPNQK